MARIELTQNQDGSFAPVELPTGARHQLFIRRTPSFVVRVVDDVGEAVEGIAIEFLIAGQSTIVISSANGIARHPHKGTQTAGIRLADLSAVRETMTPRWAAHPNGTPPQASEDVVHVPVRETWRGSTVQIGKPRTLVLLPSLVCIRLIGMHFETEKSFLLPSALQGIKQLRTLYNNHPKASVLVCGHTDTSGAKNYNLDLSVERAESIIAYLTDDLDAWNGWFSSSKPAEKRWGTRELQFMLSVLPSKDAAYYPGPIDGIYGSGTTAGVKQFQTEQGLPATGAVDEETRRVLMAAYMGMDGTTLPADVNIDLHGCGEFFPAKATGDSVATEENRRVDVFFFDGPVHPANPGLQAMANESEYPTWRDRALQTHILNTDQRETTTTNSQVSVLLRSNSGCVPLCDRPYRVDVNGTIHEGVTDADGLVQTEAIPPGDFELEVEGSKMRVPSRLHGRLPVPHVVADFFLTEFD